MSTNIYVSNLSFNVTVEEMHELFGAYGTVENVKLITDHETGRLRGFGFVEMASGGNEAIRALNGKEMGGEISPLTSPNHAKIAAPAAGKASLQPSVVKTHVYYCARIPLEVASSSSHVA